MIPVYFNKADFFTKIPKVENKTPNAIDLIKLIDFNTKLSSISDSVTSNKNESSIG